ncbi:urease accessory protein UreF [Synechococcus sp. CCY 9618]|uniref:urease accessory protein UreF n=1 Tax=Synechococcus sp. CCY 9618 TaxID=2815602 RepID=UPI001C210AE4|nr:urease accessory UreF family protein [Synechococcus sp. CCY 9618]
MSLSRLRLFQLVSPALPVGAFSYSEGLEVLVQAGSLRDADGVGRWLGAELARGGLALEASSLPRLMDALARWRDVPDGEGWEAVRQLDGWLLAQREAAELRAQLRQMGRSLLQLLSDLDLPLPPLPPAAAAGPAPRLAWPAAWAWAGLALGIDPLEVVEAYLYGWVATQLSAAVRLVPLGPTEAQRLQLALAPSIAARAADLAAADPQALWNGGVGAGLAQLGHAELYSRLFRS